MNIRKFIYPPFAKYLYGKYIKQSDSLPLSQSQQLLSLINKAENTLYGRQYNFRAIKNYDTYRKTVPLNYYETLEPYIRQMADKKPDILWPDIPKHFAMTSGTSSGRKFIPVSKESLFSQRYGRLTAMANYAIKNGRLNQLKGPMMLFSAPPSSQKYGQYNAGLLSSILSQSIPAWLKKYNLPGRDIQHFTQFDTQLTYMVKEAYAKRADIRGMVAFPPWLALFLKELNENYSIDFSGLFPHFSLLITSGMSYKPYASVINEKMGAGFDHLETYPSSEGFLAFTDTLKEEGMSFLPANGIFFEFIKHKDLYENNPERVCIEETIVNEEYAIVITTNSGLWSFVLGDTIKFISTSPWKFIITGRIGSSLSLVSENVTLNDVESCISFVCVEMHLQLQEFICSANLSVNGKSSCYEWIVELAKPYPDKAIFKQALHRQLQKLNILYEKFSHTGIIQMPVVEFAVPGSILTCMREDRYLHAQTKVPHICADYTKFCDYKKSILNNTLKKW